MSEATIELRPSLEQRVADLEVQVRELLELLGKHECLHTKTVKTIQSQGEALSKLTEALRLQQVAIDTLRGRI